MSDSVRPEWSDVEEEPLAFASQFMLRILGVRPRRPTPPNWVARRVAWGEVGWGGVVPLQMRLVVKDGLLLPVPQ